MSGKMSLLTGGQRFSLVTFYKAVLGREKESK